MVDERRACDRCGDRRIAAATGWPVLPEPAPPEEVIGPDGRAHRFAYRLLRTPGGITALAEEPGIPPGEGYALSVHGPHDASGDQLTARLREKVRAGVGRRFLGEDGRGRLRLSGDDLVGRIDEDPEDWQGLPRV